MYTWGYLKENTLSKLNLREEEALQQDFISRFPYYANEAMTQICSSIKPKEEFLVIEVDETMVGQPITFPSEFISFNDNVAEFRPNAFVPFIEAGDELLQYYGYNQVICKAVGIYEIPYNARWFFFEKDLGNSVTIPAPADICDALPSYMASQCFKIDDETKSSIFRNEYEIFLARIDNTSFKRQRTMVIGGNW